jgi:membrane protein YqaA with SNARE-associated domain
VLFKKFIAALVAFGPWGMLPLSFLDSVGIPIAGALDALLIFLAVQDPERAYVSAGLAVLGSTMGNLFLFYLAKRGAQRFIEQSSRPGRAQKFRNWFLRYGLATIFVPAMVPIPMPLKLFVFSAGALGTRIGPFLAVTVLARMVRYFGEAWLGITLRQESAGYLKAHVWHLAGFSVGLLAALYLIIWASGRRRRVVATGDKTES